MIQKIYKNTDLLFTISIGDNDNIINIADIGELSITFYTDTTNVENHIVVTKDDIINDNQIFLDNTKLDLLNEGLLKYNIKLRFNNTSIDEPFDIAKDVETEYFIKNNNYVDSTCTGGTTDTYSKSEIDLKLSLKANINDVYSKAETNEKLAEKANKTDLPDISNLATKDELKLKANKSDVYSKVEIDAKFDDIKETDLTNYYTKIEVDEKIADAGTVDLSSYYKKAEVDNKLSTKVDMIAGKMLSTNDYTDADKSKLQSLNNYDDSSIKQSLSNKQDKLVSSVNIKTINNQSLLGTGNITISGGGEPVDLSNYYDKDEVNALLTDKASISDISSLATKAELSTKADISTIAELATKTELAGKADAADVYSKTEVYNKVEVDDLIASAGTGTGGTGTSITADVLQWNNTIASEERAALYNKLLNNIYSKTASFVFLDLADGNRKYMLNISNILDEGLSRNEIKLYGSTISSSSTTVSIFNVEVILKKDGSFTINKKTSELYNKAEVDRLLSMTQDLTAIEARIATLESEITNPTNMTVDCLNYE